MNSQITSAPPKKGGISRLIDQINFRYSNVIVSNSLAGIESFQPPAEKSKVIYNGINMGRFMNLPAAENVKHKYRIHTPYTVVMAASFTPNKDYDLFYRVAAIITKRRDDITFIGVGGHHDDDSEFKRITTLCNGNKRILFPGRIADVEALVNASDIGILFSNKEIHGEGISNAIMEYMAVSKPVIANDAGGTREIVNDKKNGYLIVNHSAEEIAEMVISLIDDPARQKSYGDASKKIIDDQFSIDQMGAAFEKTYCEVLKTSITNESCIPEPL